MVLAKSKNAVGLGNSLMNDRYGKSKGADMRKGNSQGGIERTGQNGETYITNDKSDPSWMKMRSVTEQGDLDEFLSVAHLAGTDFTAEKINNIKIIHKDQKNPYLLSAAEERVAVRKHQAHKKRLTVPRRPPWGGETTARQLDQMERQSLLEWRRGLADLQENNDLLLTPFERNLEVWRQLWRVIERSDLVVQIADARNPLLFRCEDLENYVKEVDERKNNLLLVNKADMMTLEQRKLWAGYFKEKGINFRFFSAELAREANESKGVEEEEDDGIEEEDGADEHVNLDDVKDLPQEPRKSQAQEDGSSLQQGASDTEEDRSNSQGISLPKSELTRILTTDELEALFLQHAPTTDEDRKTTIGLVGYPNVGKSSTINALLGAKKVSVSATPGKTKHFQTLHLSEHVILCDCPGLVFPNFATTKAELVCNGVLPIDQLREFTGPAGLVAQRIPQSFLEAVYGMKIDTRALEEGGTGVPTAEEVLRAYARARGFATQGIGQPDESRAARYVLKDYVKGKLLFCHPPPTDPPMDPSYFNRELYNEAHLPEKRRAALRSLTSDAGTELDGLSSINDAETDITSISEVPVQGGKTAQLDNSFFARGQGYAGHVKMPFNYRYSEQGKKQLSGRKLKDVMALEKDVEVGELKGNGKKHFKGSKRKGMVGKGGDE